MKINSLQNDKNLIFYKILYTLTLVLIILRKYMITILRTDSPALSILPFLFYGSIALLFIQFIMRKNHNKSEIILLLLSSVLYVFTREGSILFIVLLAINAIDIDDKYVVKSYLITTLVFMIACMFLSNLFPHITQVEESHYRLAKGSYVLRETFGLGNPNSAFFFMLTTICSYIFLRFKSYNLLDRAILIVLTIFVYSVTLSRTGFFTIVAGLMFVEIIKHLDIKNIRWLSNLVKLSPLILSLTSLLIGTKFFDSPLLNGLLSSRPRYWHVYLVEYGNFLKPFGNNFSSAIRSQNPLDSSYVYMLAILGMVTFVLFVILMYVGIVYFIKNDKKEYLAVLSIFLIYSLAENILFEAAFNFGLVLMIKAIVLNNRKEINIYKMFKR